MARYTGPVCKLCRREAKKLYLKGDRCYTEKCAIDRRPYPPGQHGQTRIKTTDYGIRLREKQKLKRLYGLLESQFRRYFAIAVAQKGETGGKLLELLERRLDNIIFRLGFVSTRQEARQLVRHCHFLVNGKKVNLPSYLVRIGDEIQLRPASKKIARIQESIEAVDRRGVPDWLELDRKEMLGKVLAYPTKDHQIIQAMEIRDNLIVELYSK